MIKEYFRANNLKEAYEYKINGAVLLSGGGYLSKHQEDIESVVDIQKIGLNEIENAGGFITIGANVKLQTIVDNPLTPESLKVAIKRFPGSLNIRNTASIAGATLVADGKFDFLPWLLAANTKIEIYPEGKAVLLKDYLERRQSKGSFGIITKFLIPESSTIKYEVITRSPNDGVLVGVFVNQSINTGDINVCVSGYDLFPVCFHFTKSSGSIIKDIKQQLNNAYSHYKEQFCSFRYFQSMVIELYERITGE